MARLAAAGVFLVGLLLMILSLREHWFTLPQGWQSDGTLLIKDSPYTKYFQAGLLLAVAIWLLGCVIHLGMRGSSLWRNFWTTIQPRNLFSEEDSSLIQPLLSWSFLWAMVVFPLLWWYPYWVTVQDAQTSGDAAWLQQQHDNLTWLGGDVFRAHSERYNEIQLVTNMQDPPTYLGAFRPPMDSLASLGIEEIPDVIWWFGLNPAFSQFVGRGWFLAWLGAGAFGIGAFGLLKEMPNKGRRKLLQRAFLAITLSTAIPVISALLPVLKAGHHLRSAKEATLNGDFSESLQNIEKAQEWMPALRFDTSLILQQGRLQSLLQQDTTSAKIYQIWNFELLGYGARAKELLFDLEKQRQTLPPELQRELSRAWMRVTIDDFNSGRLSQAHQQFGQLCKVAPTAIQARFHHQLTSLQVGDLALNRRRQLELNKLYGPYLRKNKRGVISTSWLILAQGEWNAGNPLAAAEARRNSKGL